MDDRYKSASRYTAALSAHCSNGAREALSAHTALAVRVASVELVTEAAAIRDLLYETAQRATRLQIAIEAEGKQRDREGFVNDVRDRVMAAIDEAVQEQGCGNLLDRDLPRLFTALDELSETLLDRQEA
jgi:hypothetical protein